MNRETDMPDAKKPRDVIRIARQTPQRSVTHADLLLIVAAAVSRSAETGVPFERSLIAEIIDEMDQPLAL